jgi:hypothetical protein
MLRGVDWYLVTDFSGKTIGANFNRRFNKSTIFQNFRHYVPSQVGPCHHGMARPQVPDGGTASNMEGSCE